MLEKWQQSTDHPTPSRRRHLLVVLFGGGIAALVMLGVGLAFNQLEFLFPAIQLEYENKAVFRIWPGWSQLYMLAHPCWFGFVFALVYVLAIPGRVPTSRGRAIGTGVLYGTLVFVVGSFPVFALIYASFQVSPELLVISWAARNLVQYVVAGAVLGLVVRACRSRH
jgi:hypothetical protein